MDWLRDMFAHWLLRKALDVMPEGEMKEIYCEHISAYYLRRASILVQKYRAKYTKPTT